jgi:hypothetical protein
MVLMSGVTAARALAIDTGLTSTDRIDLGAGIEPNTPVHWSLAEPKRREAALV